MFYVNIHFSVFEKAENNAYLIGVRSVLMLRSIAGIAEGFATAWILAGVRFFASVRSEVSLEILQPRVSFEAALELRIAGE